MTLLWQMATVCVGVAIGLAEFWRLKAALGSLLYTSNSGQLQRLCKGARRRCDPGFGMKCQRQFGLAGIWVHMSELDQQWVCSRAITGGRPIRGMVAILRSEEARVLLDFVYTLLRH